MGFSLVKAVRPDVSPTVTYSDRGGDYTRANPAYVPPGWVVGPGASVAAKWTPPAEVSLAAYQSSIAPYNKKYKAVNNPINERVGSFSQSLWYADEQTAADLTAARQWAGAHNIFPKRKMGGLFGFENLKPFLVVGGAALGGAALSGAFSAAPALTVPATVTPVSAGLTVEAALPAYSGQIAAAQSFWGAAPVAAGGVAAGAAKVATGVKAAVDVAGSIAGAGASLGVLAGKRTVAPGDASAPPANVATPAAPAKSEIGLALLALVAVLAIV